MPFDPHALDRFFAEIAAAPTRDAAQDIFFRTDWLFFRMQPEVREAIYSEAADIIGEKAS